MALSSFPFKEKEELIPMSQWNLAYKIASTDPLIRSAFDNIFMEITKNGFRVTKSGKQEQLREEFEASIRENYMPALKDCVFLRLVTGYLVFLKRVNEDGEVIPVAPAWGTFVITQERQGCRFKYRCYILASDGNYKKDSAAFVKRYDGHENILTRFKYSIGTSIIENRMSDQFLRTRDLEATNVLSSPALVKQLNIPDEKNNSPDKVKEMLNEFWSTELSSLLDDKDDINMKAVEQRYEEMKRLNGKASNKQYELALYRNKLNDEDEQAIGSACSGAMNGSPSASSLSKPSQSPHNQILLEPNTQLVQQVLPQWRRDLINYIDSLKVELLETLGYVPPSTVLERNGRGVKTDLKLLDSERRNAIMPWAIVSSKILTDFFRFIYEDVKSITKLVRKKVSPRAVEIWKKDLEEERRGENKKKKKKEGKGEEGTEDDDMRPTTIITLKFVDVLPQTLLDDLFAKQLITRERFLVESLESQALNQNKLAAIVEESRAKGLFEENISRVDATTHSSPSSPPSPKNKGKKKGDEDEEEEEEEEEERVAKGRSKGSQNKRKKARNDNNKNKKKNNNKKSKNN